MTASTVQKKAITLALQGGGSHGAFTWGVLDRLLEEETLQIEALSGTSAGAINGALMATGLIAEGPRRAKKLLHDFWKALSELSSVFAPFKSSVGSDSPFMEKALQGAVSFWRDVYTQIVSPYDSPVRYNNPLKELLKDRVDFDQIRSSKLIKLYVSATNVETNRLKLFSNEDLCLEALLASSCLPLMQPAVAWQGNYYWDGGFMGNPTLEPLIYACTTRDLVIVPVNPITRPGVPKTTREIIDRMNEVTFNSSLMRELRGIVNIRNILRVEDKENPYTHLRLHSIQDDVFMLQFSASSKYDADWDFLCRLRQGGRRAAEHWLNKNKSFIGVNSTIDEASWHFHAPF